LTGLYPWPLMGDIRSAIRLMAACMFSCKYWHTEGHVQLVSLESLVACQAQAAVNTPAWEPVRNMQLLMITVGSGAHRTTSTHRSG
jgi:hypothetical protein